ncbi:MAG: Crp/Fnr family transcriptional regulator [Flavobacterium sp.]
MTLTTQLQHLLALSPLEASIAEDLFTTISFDKAEILISPLQHSCPLYFILSGYVRVYAIHEDKEITQWIGSPDYFMTDLSAWIFGSPIKWTIEAITPVRAVYINQNDYQKLASQVNNWHEKEKVFIAHCFEQMEQRIFQFISLSAEQRYAAFFKQLGSLFNEVPHQYIASMLGITPETLSRIRKKVAKE